MTIRQGSQNARILGSLANGRWHTTARIHREAGTSRLNSRISELRNYGYVIEHEKVPGKTGPRGHRYRLLGVPDGTPLPQARMVLERLAERRADQVTPRTPDKRFRLYRLCDDDSLDLVGTCAEPEEIGWEIIRLSAEGEWGRCSFGLLDTHGRDGNPGTWILNPWDARVRNV